MGRSFFKTLEHYTHQISGERTNWKHFFYSDRKISHLNLMGGLFPENDLGFF